MIALVLLLLGIVAVYLGVIGAAFATLMRLSLRLVAERSSRTSRLGVYLDDPVGLFLPVRAMLGAVHVAAVLCFVILVGLDAAQRVALVVVASAAFIIAFEHLIPYLIVRRDPERVLEVLLPSFDRLSWLAWPLVAPLGVVLAAGRDREPVGSPAAIDEAQQEATEAYLDAGEQEGLIERDERQLLQSVVDFGDTLVHEVMTPRPDIVAIRSTATLDELRSFFREQEYSRIPVYADSLDNIVGFVFIKDLMRLPAGQSGDRPVSTLLRPAHVVPETKRVSDLLREFQRQQLQIAIVVDEYGGTAGLVTLEDLLEEIVGEIRDEYDVETEAVVDEGNGRFLVTGKADIETVAERLGIEIEPEGFETFGGYLLAHLGRVPAVGETFDIDTLAVEVLDAERRRVLRVRVWPRTTETAPGPKRAEPANRQAEVSS
ncbi:MAG: hemolysin family protein [Acidobacteria bacterium]|nr:hemolysin family protein [Acidobacteriota bacterium]